MRDAEATVYFPAAMRSLLRHCGQAHPSHWRNQRTEPFEFKMHLHHLQPRPKVVREHREHGWTSCTLCAGNIWKHYVCVCGTCIRPSQKRVEYRAETDGKIGLREHEVTVWAGGSEDRAPSGHFGRGFAFARLKNIQKPPSHIAGDGVQPQDSPIILPFFLCRCHFWGIPTYLQTLRLKMSGQDQRLKPRFIPVFGAVEPQIISHIQIILTPPIR